MTYTIEKDIPLPPNYMEGTKYPFRKMAPGDSFTVSIEFGPRVRNAAGNWGKNNNATFSTRRNGDGYRCWRIK